MKLPFFKNQCNSKRILYCTGIALTDIKPKGIIKIDNEKWIAKSGNNQQINKNDKIKIVDIKNVHLIIKKI